ncbi:MAG: hypothetical protein AB7I59_08410 [Geminicoccaceae bacterium]
MTPGAGFSPDSRTLPGRTAAWGGVAAASAVAVLGYLYSVPAEPRPSPSETASAQRAATLVAGIYRARVDLDRRDRTFLISYADGMIMDADRIAWAVCDTIRNQSDMPDAARALRDWQVVTLPAAGGPGSCRIGVLR